MAKRTARFAFAILAGSTLLTFLPCATIAAAEDCLTEPAGGTAGQHWYYRFDRNSNRRCWYLKDKDTAPRLAQQPQGQQQQPWDFAQQPAPPRLAPRRTETAPSRSGADTLAELSSPRLRVDDVKGGARPFPVSASTSIGKAPTTADTSLDRNGGDAPWPQPQAQFELLNAATSDAGAPAAATAPVADQPDPGAGTSSAPTVIDASEPASAKPVKPAASLHMLLLIVVGALAISGFMASAMYRLSKIGRRRRRNANWKTAIARARRARAKPHIKPNTNHVGPRPGRVAKQPAKTVPARVGSGPAAGEIAVAVSRPTSAATDLPDVREPRIAKPTVRSDTATATQLSGTPVTTTENVAQHADSIAELAELLEFRAAKSTRNVPQPVGNATPPSSVAPPSVAPKAGSPKAGSPKTGSPKAGNPKAAPAEDPPAKPLDPVVELTELLQSRAAKKASKATKQPISAAAAPPVDPQAKPRQVPSEVLVTKPTAPVAKLSDLSHSLSATIPTKIAAPESADPAAELIGLLDTRFALPAAGPSPAAARKAAKPVTAAETRIPPVRKAVPDEAAPDNGVADRPAPRPKKAAQHPQERVASNRKVKRRPVAVADVPPPITDDPAAALIDMLESRAAKPADRAADASTPPLDFIPRPQALRPRAKSVRQDESLDGIQDILARLARHA
jgi:hypothetical protein